MLKPYFISPTGPIWTETSDGRRLDYVMLYHTIFDQMPVFSSIQFPEHGGKVNHIALFEKVKSSGFEFEYILSGATAPANRHLPYFRLIYTPLRLFIHCDTRGYIFVYTAQDYLRSERYTVQVKTFMEDLLEDVMVKKEESTPYLSILQLGGMGEYELSQRSLNSMPDFSIKENYNDDFEEIHDIIVKGLLRKEGKGIVLLHGEPGTGKSTYLKYLCQHIQDKTLIFIPPDVAQNLGTPAFMGFLANQQDSILIIEDAEELIQSRDSGVRSSAVSNILNISDGLLSDIMRISIIATCNAQIGDIDPALLRKGRLIAKYEFGKLSPDKCNAILEKNGHTYRATQPMTLTDVYNPEEKAFHNTERRRIGFTV